jgi:hypothetical protein
MPEKTKRRRPTGGKARTTTFAYIEGDTYDSDDATEDVTLERAATDLWRAKPGRAGECMNALCIMRHRDLFPFPVVGVAVIRSRAYVIDRAPILDDRGKTLQRGHVYRYVLSAKATAEIDLHDTEALGLTGDLELLAPTGAAKAGARHPGANRGKRTGERSARILGSKARVMAAVGAGLISEEA